MFRRFLMLSIIAVLLIPATAMADNGSGGASAPTTSSATGGTAAPDDQTVTDDQHQCSADPPEVNLNCPLETGTVPYGIRGVKKTLRARSWNAAVRKGVAYQSALDFTLNYNYTDIFSVKLKKGGPIVRKYAVTVYVYLYDTPEAGPFANTYDVRVVKLCQSGKYRVTATLREPVRYLHKVQSFAAH